MIKPFKDKDPFKLAEQINEFCKRYKSQATQVFPSSPWSEYWIGFVYYDSLVLNQSVKSDLTTARDTGEKPVTKDSNSSNNSPTQKQIDFLKKNNWTGELPKTRQEATIIINDYLKNLKKENI